LEEELRDQRALIDALTAESLDLREESALQVRNGITRTVLQYSCAV